MFKLYPTCWIQPIFVHPQTKAVGVCITASWELQKGWYYSSKSILTWFISLKFDSLIFLDTSVMKDLGPCSNISLVWVRFAGGEELKRVSRQGLALHSSFPIWLLMHFPPPLTADFGRRERVNQAKINPQGFHWAPGMVKPLMRSEGVQNTCVHMHNALCQICSWPGSQIVCKCFEIFRSVFGCGWSSQQPPISFIVPSPAWVLSILL